MSIERHSATEIRNAGLNYISLPSQIVEALAITGGIEAVGLWTVMNNNATNFAIIKKVVCKKYGCSERSFTRCMTAMEKLELAWIEVAPRTKDGKLGGKNWCVSNLPKSVQEKLDSAVNAMCEIAGSVEKTGDEPTPSKMQCRSPTPSKLPTSAENRPSVNCRDITKNESLTKYESSSSCVPRQESGVNVQARLKTKITAGWQPDQSCLDRIQLSGVPREFAFECLPEFVSYWLDRGTARESWHSAFTQCVKRNWEHARANPKPVNQPQATRIPDQFALDAERMAISQRLAPDLMNDIDLIFNRFVAHYRSSTGERSLSADWDSQWVKWLTGEVKQHKKPAFKTKRDSLREAYEADMTAIMTDVSWAIGR